MTTLAVALAEAKKLLFLISNTPELDAALILAHVLSQERSYIFAYPDQKLTKEQQEYYEKLLDKRIKKIPLAYLLGKKEFWSQSFTVNPSVLIPRPETELLVEKILEHHGHLKNLCGIDLGTGSGAIVISLADNTQAWNFIGIDKYKDALNLARWNAANLLKKVRRTLKDQDFLKYDFSTEGKPTVTTSIRATLQSISEIGLRIELSSCLNPSKNLFCRKAEIERQT